MDKVCAYLGPAGTYSEEAAQKYAGGTYLLKPYPSFDSVFAAVADQETARGLVPVENYLEGSVNLTLDLLLKFAAAVKIHGELLCIIRHFLLARPGQKAAQIKEIFSHPQALAQCRSYLDRYFPEAARIGMSSTAEAAALVAQSPGKAMIASQQAAELYGLEVLRAEIQDEALNITRFLVLAREDAPPSGRDKTSLLIGLPDQPGSLHRALGVFAAAGLNLTKIESRPIRGEPGKYIFFLDIEGHREEEKMAKALQKTGDGALFLKVLGSYPRAAAPL